jgi:hypothetical protein
VELARLKLVDMDPAFDDEVNYFLDVMELYMDKDYDVNKSLEEAKPASKYYVSPHLFNTLIEIN